MQGNLVPQQQLGRCRSPSSRCLLSRTGSMSPVVARCVVSIQLPQSSMRTSAAMGALASEHSVTVWMSITMKI